MLQPRGMPASLDLILDSGSFETIPSSNPGMRTSVVVIASDGKSEGISWYAGATEQAVIRCASVALGLSPKGTAHLVWKSGDIVDFGEPIKNGATLYLDATVHKDKDAAFFESEGIHKRIVPQRKSQTWSGEPSKVERESSEDDELQPLLQTRSKVSRSQSIDNNDGETDSSSSQGVSERRMDGAREQRGSILKIKRILAHLANERTFLAWLRVAGKLFSAGSLSLTLAGKTSGSYALCFVVLGLFYFSLCPYVVFVGLRRFHEAAAVMQGTVHEAYAYFMGSDLQAVTALMSCLASVTVAVMVVQLLSG